MGFIAAIAALVMAGVIYQQIGARRHRQRFTPPGSLIDVGGHRLHVTGSAVAVRSFCSNPASQPLP